MKIRSGFVSNSSSSSFVLLGIKITDDELLKKLGWKEGEPNLDEKGNAITLYTFLNRKIDELGLWQDSEEELIGYLIADGNDSDFTGKEISITELNNKALSISLSLNVPLEDIKIYSGIRSC